MIECTSNYCAELLPGAARSVCGSPEGCLYSGCKIWSSFKCFDFAKVAPCLWLCFGFLERGILGWSHGWECVFWTMGLIYLWPVLLVWMLQGISGLTADISDMKPQRSQCKKYYFVIRMSNDFCLVFTQCKPSANSEMSVLCRWCFVVLNTFWGKDQRPEIWGHGSLLESAGFLEPKSSSISGMCPPPLVTTRTPLESCDNGWSKLDWAAFSQIGLFTYLFFF